MLRTTEATACMKPARERLGGSEEEEEEGLPSTAAAAALVGGGGGGGFPWVCCPVLLNRAGQGEEKKEKMSSVRRMELWAHVTFWAKKGNAAAEKGKNFGLQLHTFRSNKNVHDATVTNLQLLDQMCWYCTYKGRAIFGIFGYIYSETAAITGRKRRRELKK